ncbi:hypothetical protein SAMN04489729_5519 [Amycolatopsis lurida]|uniref:Uncharacterized protein n=1 Tax=Amycolatopsis lurida NRRL 2430 TaxID=1460371 RepID=A0A2P2FVL8_AMYLU|nr:hypothetical protein [Amycolatopsis lurida]KFU80777.1 hypothetical protein BB31_12565 [Amycolatopsis lurida NRRL 2430]SED85978.1 hypothetical protein SAMN04489729_5519 [Amycolatopsis lurida]
MHHTTRDVLGEAAYLRRSCDILIDQLKEIDRLATGTEELAPVHEAAVADANVKAAGAKEHLELAGRYIGQWKQALTQTLVGGPPWSL